MWILQMLIKMWLLLKECWSAKLLACKIVGSKNCMFSYLWVLKNVASTHAPRMMGTHTLCVLKFVRTKSNLYVLYLWVLTSGFLCILSLNMCYGYMIVVLPCGYVLCIKHVVGLWVIAFKHTSLNTLSTDKVYQSADNFPKIGRP